MARMSSAKIKVRPSATSSPPTARWNLCALRASVICGMRRPSMDLFHFGDLLLFFCNHRLRKRSIAQARRVFLAGGQHPVEEFGDRSSLSRVLDMAGDQQPCVAGDGIEPAPCALVIEPRKSAGRSLDAAPPRSRSSKLGTTNLPAAFFTSARHFRFGRVDQFDITN